MNNQYHIGLCKRGNTMVIETAKCVDYLSCEVYDYLGVRLTTKNSLKKNRYSILKMMQKQKPEVYGNLKYAVVE